MPKFNEVRILKMKKKVEREKTLLSDFKTFDGREQIKFEIQLQLKHFGSRLSEEKDIVFGICVALLLLLFVAGASSS